MASEYTNIVDLARDLVAIPSVNPMGRDDLAGTGELGVVVLDLVFEPPQVLDRLAFTRGEGFDELFAAVRVFLEATLFFAALDQISVHRQVRHDDDVQSLTNQCN